MQSAILLHSSLTYCDMVHNSHNLCYTAEVTSLNFKPMVDPVHRIDSFFNRVIFFLFSCFFYSQLIDHQIDLNHIANELHQIHPTIALLFFANQCNKILFNSFYK